MNHTQLYLSIGIPTLTVILAWLANRADYHSLSDKVDQLAASVQAENLAMRRDLAADNVSMRKDIAAEMIAFRREAHSDMVMLHERVVKVETRQDR